MKFLFLISSDPRTSGGPAEAVRIAAGLAAGREIDLTLCLCGPAALALSERCEEFVDGDFFTQFWPVWAETQREVWVHTTPAYLEHVRESPVPCRIVTTDELAHAASACASVSRF